MSFRNKSKAGTPQDAPNVLVTLKAQVAQLEHMIKCGDDHQRMLSIYSMREIEQNVELHKIRLQVETIENAMAALQKAINHYVETAEENKNV